MAATVYERELATPEQGQNSVTNASWCNFKQHRPSPRVMLLETIRNDDF